MEDKICDRVLTLLNEYIDGELNADDAEFVRAHIEDCADCKKAYLELLEIEKLFDEASKEVPDGFLDSVMAKISDEKKKTVKTKKVIPHFAFKFGGVALAAAVMLTVIASPIIPTFLKNQTESAKDLAYSSQIEASLADDCLVEDADKYEFYDGEADSNLKNGASPAEEEVAAEAVTDACEVITPAFEIKHGTYYAFNMSDGETAKAVFEDGDSAVLEKDGESISYSYERVGNQVVFSNKDETLKFEIFYGEQICFNQSDN